jgi:Xaa-Pro aminopeptidase
MSQLAITRTEFEHRLSALQTRMAESGLNAVLVYGDEKHYENVKYLTGFDPRFESALVIVPSRDHPLVITGVESLAVFALTGRLGSAIPFLPFSIPGLVANSPSDLRSLLTEASLRRGQRVGLIGQSYFTGTLSDRSHRHFVPHFVWEAVVDTVGSPGLVENATGWLLDPVTGLRSAKSADEIALLEAASVFSGRAIAAMMAEARVGRTELEIMTLGFAAGGQATFGFQPTVLAGVERARSTLVSPGYRRLEHGDPVSFHYGPTVDGYVGNVSRTALLARAATDLGSDRVDTIDALYQPMFDAYVALLETIRVGAPGATVHRAVADSLAKAGLTSDYNAGHLIGLAEWEGTVTTVDSRVALRSGHVFQADFHVLNRHSTHGPARVQDGYALADGPLRRELRGRWSETWGRIERRRRRFGRLGIRLHESVLPLSDLAPEIRPFLLDPRIRLQRTA